MSWPISAWTSSVHIRHLDLLRDDHPKGSFLGAYGFVLGLKPEREPIPPTGPRIYDDDPGTSGGFVAAHSLDQTATMAVLRNAYLTQAQEEESADLLRLDLDSGESARARWVSANAWRIDAPTRTSTSSSWRAAYVTVAS